MQSLCKLGCGGKGMVDERQAGKHCTVLILLIYVICVSALHACMCAMCLWSRDVCS